MSGISMVSRLRFMARGSIADALGRNVANFGVFAVVVSHILLLPVAGRGAPI
jgi:hypothetical protein